MVATGLGALPARKWPCNTCCMDPEAKRAALALLARGLITIPEAAKLAGVPRYTICRWVRGKRERFGRTRDTKIADMWRRELQRGPRLVEEAKPAARHVAESAATSAASDVEA